LPDGGAVPGIVEVFIQEKAVHLRYLQQTANIPRTGFVNVSLQRGNG
jgi:hypothetical protein